MLSAPLLGNAPPSYGTIRVLAPLPEVLSNNLSHIKEAYQNLPQIGRPIILPLQYKPFHQQNPYREYGYNNEFQIIGPYSSRFQMNRKDYRSDRRNVDEVFHNRDDGYDGYGHGGDAGSHRKSPALSALALLGFMFFLNLIQTSLQNNRQILTAAALNGTTLGVVAGRMRHKRDVPLDDNMNEVTRGHFSHLRTDDHSSLTSSHEGHVHFTSSIKSEKMQLMNNRDPIENFKSASLHCLSLLSCKLAKHIFYDIHAKTQNANTRIILHILRESISTGIGPRKPWTSNMIQAFSDGWKSGTKCESLYKKCLLFNSEFVTPSIRKRRESY